MERPHRLVPAGTSIFLMDASNQSHLDGVASTYSYDHGRPNPPKFFFEAVLWRSTSSVPEADFTLVKSALVALCQAPWCVFITHFWVLPYGRAFWLPQSAGQQTSK